MAIFAMEGEFSSIWHSNHMPPTYVLHFYTNFRLHTRMVFPKARDPVYVLFDDLHAFLCLHHRASS